MNQEEIFRFIQNHIEYAPYVFCGLLLLAGFLIPIPEDVILFIAGVLAYQNPEHLYPIFIGTFVGIYFSDLICYGFVGRCLGKRIFKITFFSRLISARQIKKMEKFYRRYGAWTLFFGRFIPFGVRNALFFTAGLSKMDIRRFVIIDFCSSLISSTVFFTLYYHFGELVLGYIKRANIIVISLVVLISLVVIWRKKQ